MVDPLGNEKLFGFLKTSMDASSMAHQVVASNIANIDTPGFKARTMNFEAILKDFEDQENMMPRDLPKSDRPLPPAPALNFKDYVVEEVTDHLTERFDGNNVDLDKEMGTMAKMRGRFEMSQLFMTRKVRLLNDTIMSGR